MSRENRADPRPCRMNMRPVCAALVIAALSFPCAAVTAANADSVLRKTGIFALGGIGAAGTMSEGEQALRETRGSRHSAEELGHQLTGADEDDQRSYGDWNRFYGPRRPGRCPTAPQRRVIQ